jgi:hypothetical protein
MLGNIYGLLLVILIFGSIGIANLICFSIYICIKNYINNRNRSYSDASTEYFITIDTP